VCHQVALIELLAQWQCTPRECHVLLRLLMLWPPGEIARERGVSVSHVRNTINRIVQKSGSTGGVPGMLARAAEVMHPMAQQPTVAFLDAVTTEVQTRRGQWAR
jgi:DNA-binding CsgD family transcriptional regulator